jgi:D-serine deaminase-like pyridoxal phosphate-dependent protein
LASARAADHSERAVVVHAILLDRHSGDFPEAIASGSGHELDVLAERQAARLLAPECVALLEDVRAADR